MTILNLYLFSFVKHNLHTLPFCRNDYLTHMFKDVSHMASALFKPSNESYLYY